MKLFFFQILFKLFCSQTQKTEQWHKIIYWSLENYSLSIRHSSNAIKHLKIQKAQPGYDKGIHIISRMSIMTWKKNSLHREEDESIWENANGWIITCSLNYPVLNRVVFKEIPIGSCQKADIPKCHLVDTGRSSGTEILNQKVLVFERSIFQLQVWITGRMPESLYSRAKWESKAMNVPGR